MPVITGGNVIEGAIPRGSGDSGFDHAIVAIERSEILTLRTSPVVLVPAQGPGTSIYMHGAIVHKSGGSTVYAIASASTVAFQFETGSPQTRMDTRIFTDGAGETWRAVSAWSATVNNNSAHAINENEALVLKLDGTNDLTGGDARQHLVVHVYYQLATNS